MAFSSSVWGVACPDIWIAGSPHPGFRNALWAGILRIANDVLNIEEFSAGSVIPGELGFISRAGARLGVAAEGGEIALRAAYEREVGSIADRVAAWAKAGADPEFVPREAWADRRAIGIYYKALTPPELREILFARNLARYGDPLGPTIEYLRAQGRTWEQIIEGASRSGGRDLGF